MSDNDLIGGLYPKPKHANAPDFVIGKLSINVKQFREWMAGYLKAHPDDEWINIDMKQSRAGKGYAAVDTWKPSQKAEPAPQQVKEMDDIPFN